jgi:gamma-glutamyltranspeptidase/glutathione hydrolase
MSPTIVLKDSQPVLGVGAAGGPTIISQTVLAIVNTVDFGQPIDVALAQPRFHHQWKPDQLKIEKTAGDAVLRELRRRGHKLSVVKSIGAAQAVSRSTTNEHFTGSADPRGEGSAKGF